jgi:EmrB/QacA subfamily drug resistance transporter
MMAGRVLQASGNGILVAMAQVVILSIYPVEKKGSMMGNYGLATTAAPIIAPTIAGMLVDSVGWRSIFIITFAVMVVSLIMALIVFDDVLDQQDKQFDFVSFIGTVFAFGGVTLGIGNIGSQGITSIQTYLPLAVGIVASVLFVYRQLHLETPFLDVRILKCKEYTISVIGSMLLYLVMMGSSVLMPLYVQSVMGYSATVSGLVTLPGSLATAVASPFAGRIYDKMGIKKLFVAGSALMLFSNVSMFFLTMSTPVWAAALLNVFRNVAIGCLMMPLLTWGTSYVHFTKVADASSLLTSLRTISGSIGAAVFVAVMTAVGAKTTPIRGVNTAFISMAAVTFIMLLIAVFTVKDSSKSAQKSAQK